MFVRNLPIICLLFVVLLASTPSHGVTLQVKGDFIYDDTLKIYWTKNANINGKMSWAEAKTWISDLNASSYGGFNDWRLPSTPDGTWGYNGTNEYKYNVTSSELGHLYYTSFGLEAKIPPISSYTQDTLPVFGNPFEGLQPDLYWFGTVSKTSSLPGGIWKFDFSRGTQFLETANANPAYALAVRSATPVPEPSSAWLFLTGLMALPLKRCRR